MRRTALRAVAALGVAGASIMFGPDPVLRGGDEPSRPPSSSVPVAVWPAVESGVVVAVIETTTSTNPPQPVVTRPHELPTPAGDGAVWAHLARIRACESGSNYGAVSPSGAYRGAYQWSASTWRWSSEGAGHPGYQYATDAPPAVQDAVAYWLYTTSGPGQWPVCQHR